MEVDPLRIFALFESSDLRPDTLPLLGALPLAPEEARRELDRLVFSGAWVIDGYRVVGRLGEGGMGLVLRVVDSVGRELALKLQTEPRPAAAVRFEREGEVTARLRHPNVVSIHGAGEIEGRPYLVYELIEGTDLSEVMDRLSREELLQAVLEAAEGLAHAHAHGVIHRDVKPGNILIGQDGRVRVADFGLAWGEALDRLTRTGAAVGTPHYMAPEQVAARTDRYGPPTDVWALGVMLYEGLTGAEPFDGESITELMAAILGGEPADPSALDPTVSPQLAAVCLQALRKEPAERYPDAGAFAADLARAVAGQAVDARAPARKRGRAIAAGVALLLVVGLGAGVAVSSWDPRAGAREALEEERAWAAETLDPLALTVFGDGGLTPDDLARRRERLLPLREALPEGVAEAVARLDVHARLLRAAAGEPVAVPAPTAGRSVADLTADAVILARRGEAREARKRLSLARRRDPSFRPARQAGLLLLGPEALLTAAERDAEAARVLKGSWRRWAGRAAAEAAEGPVAWALAMPAALDGVPEDERRAALRVALEEASQAWGAALERAFDSQTEEAAIDRLAALLGAWGGPRTGPRLAESLSAALERLGQEVGARLIRNPRTPALVLVEVRLFYLCAGMKPPSNIVDLMSSGYWSRISNLTPDHRVAAALGSLRVYAHLETDYAGDMVERPAHLAPWLEAYPESRAIHLVRAQTLVASREADGSPDVGDEVVRELELAVSAPLEDLLAVHQAGAWLELAEARLARAVERGLPGDSRVFVAALRARELGASRLAVVGDSLAVECRAVEAFEGAKAASARWAAALETVERLAQGWAPTPGDRTLAAELALLRTGYAGCLEAAGEVDAAWATLAGALDRSPDDASSPVLEYEVQVLATAIGLAERTRTPGRAAALIRPRVAALLASPAGVAVSPLAFLVVQERRSGRAAEADALLAAARDRFPHAKLLGQLSRR